MLGSTRTAKVYIGEALATCWKVIPVSTRRLPSRAVMVNGRDISCPGSGAAPVTETSTDPVAAGATSSMAGSKRKPTASSGSEPANLSRTLPERPAAEMLPCPSRPQARSRALGSAASPWSPRFAQILAQVSPRGRRHCRRPFLGCRCEPLEAHYVPRQPAMLVAHRHPLRLSRRDHRLGWVHERAKVATP